MSWPWVIVCHKLCVNARLFPTALQPGARPYSHHAKKKKNIGRIVGYEDRKDRRRDILPPFPSPFSPTPPLHLHLHLHPLSLGVTSYLCPGGRLCLSHSLSWAAATVRGASLAWLESRRKDLGTWSSGLSSHGRRVGGEGLGGGGCGGGGGGERATDRVGEREGDAPVEPCLWQGSLSDRREKRKGWLGCNTHTHTNMSLSLKGTRPPPPPPRLTCIQWRFDPVFYQKRRRFLKIFFWPRLALCWVLCINATFGHGEHKRA